MKIKIFLIAFLLCVSFAVKAQAPDTIETLTFAEVMPAFPYEGGFPGYLATHVKYPEAEKKAGKQGTVYISFVIEKDGSVTNVKEAKGVPGAPGFTEEGILVISGMPNWTPGTMNGYPVRIEMKQPIRFTLTDGAAKKETSAGPSSVSNEPVMTDPSFIGGNSALANYLKTNLVYPKQEKEKNTEGTVVVGFYVEADGSLTAVQLISKVPNAPGLNNEAIRLIKAMPKWKPGEKDGVAVRKWVLVPVEFKL